MRPPPETRGLRVPGPRRASLAAVLAAVALLACGCLSRSPVGTEYVGPEFREIEECALYSDQASSSTRFLLRLVEQEEAFETEPYAVLERIHALCIAQPVRTRAFALSELAYLTGKRFDDPDAFLLSALAAFTFLEGDVEIWGPPANRYSRRLRWACDLYNRSVGRAFPGGERGTLQMTAGVRELPGGTLDVRLDHAGFPFSQQGLELLLASEYATRGLQYRLRDSGLGAPLIAVVRRHLDGSAIEITNLDRTSVSATAFLRPHGDLMQLREGLTASLELHSTYDAKSVEVGGRMIPLEADQSATVAFGTELAGYWRHDLQGLFRGQDASRMNGLVLPRPYEPGRIPVVLVHGTASSPTYWAEMLNSMAADSELRSKYQFWLFLYNTGNPIAYSAGTLREQLREFIAVRDPEGQDEALQRMVLIGHSQGGLLVRMMGVTLDADETSTRVLGVPVAELGLDDDQQDLLRSLFDVEPLPFVESLVFISTPHRGSFLADSMLARTLSKMIALPGEIITVSEEIVTNTRGPEGDLPGKVKPRVHTSLDNMNPSSSFLTTLQYAPLDPRLEIHSIIAIGDYPGPEGANDGVVAFESAHLDFADSETLIPAHHSCQSHPRTLMAVRRILRNHIGLDAIEPASDLFGTP